VTVADIARARLNAYILDHLRKQNLTASAEAFSKEANVPGDSVLIDAPGGFLFEWWSVFWDILSARTKKPASESARSYVEQQRQMAQWRRRSFDPSAMDLVRPRLMPRASCLLRCLPSPYRWRLTRMRPLLALPCDRRQCRLAPLT